MIWRNILLPKWKKRDFKLADYIIVGRDYVIVARIML